MQIARFSPITSHTQKPMSNTRFGAKPKPAQSKSNAKATSSDTWHKSSFGEYLTDPNVRNSGKMDHSDYLRSQGLNKAPAYEGKGFGDKQEWPGWEWTHDSVFEEEEQLEPKKKEAKEEERPKKKK